jgi:hypothetical protein
MRHMLAILADGFVPTPASRGDHGRLPDLMRPFPSIFLLNGVALYLCAEFREDAG